MNEPMRYLPPLTGEKLAAYQSMPKLSGCVMNLFQIEDEVKRERYEAAWREWATGRDRSTWPEWLERWASEKKRRASRNP